jgi:hypothetical protein
MWLARVAVTRLRHCAAFVCLLATSRHSPLKPNKAGELALGQCLDAISKCSAALEHTNEIDGVTLRELHVCTHTHTRLAPRPGTTAISTGALCSVLCPGWLATAADDEF